MTATLCPLYEDDNYGYELALDSVNHYFTFWYNERLEAYMLNLSNADEEVLIENYPLRPYFPMLSQYRFTGLSGYFALVPYQVPPKGSYPDVESGKDIANTHFLVYENGE